jgi:hypothetical protein
LTTFRNLLTDDFQLVAFGKKYNKQESIELASVYSEVKYNYK